MSLTMSLGLLNSKISTLSTELTGWLKMNQSTLVKKGVGYWSILELISIMFLKNCSGISSGNSKPMIVEWSVKCRILSWSLKESKLMSMSC